MLKVAQVEGKRWQDELQKFLLAYRSTPQASKGATPAFLMFSREIRTKLPELRRDKVVLNEEIRDRDWRNKVSQKVYADTKHGAKENDIVLGDQVLLKNTKATGKLAPTQVAFHMGPSWALIWPSLAPVGPQLSSTGTHLGMLLG